MSLSVVLKFALRNVLRNVRRSAVTVVTVAAGGGALFLFHAFIVGIMHQYRENAVHARYGYGQINTRNYREQVYEKPWEHWMDNASSLEKQIKQLPGVTHTFPRVEFFALLTNEKMTVSGRGVGIVGSREAPFFNTINIVQGKMLEHEDDGVVLGVGLARSLAVKVGDRITVLGNTIHGSLNALDLTVTGIFHAGTREVDDVLFQIQLKQAHLLLDTDRVESITLGMSDYDVWEPFKQAFEKKFGASLEATPFAVIDKIYYQHAVDFLQRQYEVIRFIILSIVILAIFNTASGAILERTREFGILRANGESARDLLTLLFWEGFYIAAAGALLGLGTVLVLQLTLLRNGIIMPPSPGLTRELPIHLKLEVGMAVEAFVLSTGAAVAASLLAGWKVARMQIGSALRAPA